MRWAPFLAGLAASLALTAVLWRLGFPGFFLFLLFPFLWFPRGAATPTCPSCGRRAEAGHSFCPGCGSRL